MVRSRSLLVLSACVALTASAAAFVTDAGGRVGGVGAAASASTSAALRRRPVTSIAAPGGPPIPSRWKALKDCERPPRWREVRPADGRGRGRGRGRRRLLFFFSQWKDKEARSLRQQHACALSSREVLLTDEDCKLQDEEDEITAKIQAARECPIGSEGEFSTYETLPVRSLNL